MHFLAKINFGGNDWQKLAGSFIKAIEDANANAGRDTIEFSLTSAQIVTGDNWGTVIPITDELFIDGTSTDAGVITLQNFAITLSAANSKIEASIKK